MLHHLAAYEFMGFLLVAAICMVPSQVVRLAQARLVMRMATFTIINMILKDSEAYVIGIGGTRLRSMGFDEDETCGGMW